MTQSTEEPARVRLPMVCRCGDERRVEWTKRVAAAQEKVAPAPVEFVTGMVHEFNNAYSPWWFHIGSVYADQWLGVAVVGRNYMTDQRAKVYVECDRFEDGLTAIWEYLNENYERSGEW